MILVRDVFQVKFGKMKEALGQIKEAEKSGVMPNDGKGRICTDLVGQYYTLVMENTFKDMTDFESQVVNGNRPKEWKDWYSKFTPYVENGHREIYNIVQ